MKLLILIPLLFNLPFVVFAATMEWDTPGTSGNWATSGNWDPSSVPGALDTVDLTDSSNSSTEIVINSSQQVFDFAGTTAYGQITIEDGGSLTGWGTASTSFRGSGMTVVIESGGEFAGGSPSSQTLRFDTTIDTGGELNGFTVFQAMDLVVNGTFEPQGASSTGNITLNTSGGGLSITGSGSIRLDADGDDDNEKFLFAGSPTVNFSGLSSIDIVANYAAQIGDTYDLWNVTSGDSSNITFGSGTNIVLTGASGLTLDTTNWASTGVVEVIEDTSGGGEEVDEITQYGITWTFSTDVTAGQFVNGDWWVLDEGSGVTVSSVSPGTSGGRNGSMINPEVGTDQGFDDRASGGTYDSGLNVSFPLSLEGGDALLSSISRASESGDWDGANIDSKAKLNTVAVLTIVDSVPPADAFRPSYMDRSQTIYRASDIDYESIPELDTAGITFESGVDLEYCERGLERPWMLFISDWMGRDLHPHQNQKGYHREVGKFLSKATLMLVTDLEDKETLINRYVQLGIDYYYVGIQGYGDSTYYVAPVVIAGHFLDDSDMMDAFINDDILSMPRDYADFYYYADRNDTTTSSIVPAGETWSGHTVFFRNNLAINRGYEHLHPSEWYLTSKGEDEAFKDEDYRIGQDSKQHVGMILAAMILDLQTEWDHNATFDYMDRWMDDADPAAEYAILSIYDAGALQADKSSDSSFIDDMWDLYRSSY